MPDLWLLASLLNHETAHDMKTPTEMTVPQLTLRTLLTGNLQRASARGLFLGFCVFLAAHRCPAQPFPPQGDDVTPSMGVFRLVVDPLFRPLLSPTGPPTSFVGYIGFHSSDGRLTSPMLIDRRQS